MSSEPPGFQFRMVASLVIGILLARLLWFWLGWQVNLWTFVVALLLTPLAWGLFRLGVYVLWMVSWVIFLALRMPVMLMSTAVRWLRSRFGR